MSHRQGSRACGRAAGRQLVRAARTERDCGMTSLRIKRITACSAGRCAGARPRAASQPRPVRRARAHPGPPQVTTGGVSHVTRHLGDAHGHGRSAHLATTYYFQYGPTTPYGSQTTPGHACRRDNKRQGGQARNRDAAGLPLPPGGDNADGTRSATTGCSSPTKATKAAFALPKARADPVGGRSCSAAPDRAGQRRRDRAAGDPVPLPRGFTTSARHRTGAGGVRLPRAEPADEHEFRVSRLGTPPCTARSSQAGRGACD